ncbi:MAG TPA: replicative DNA helicase, partial [Actinobacteria bacterium]|nr:replicative DNA helicase [Actinomycetota bacterium]
MFIEAEGYAVRPRSHLRYSIALPDTAPVAERTCLVCGKAFTPQRPMVRTCGRSCGGRLTTIAKPIPHPRCPDCGRSTIGFIRCQACHDDHGSVQALMRRMKVLGDKHIPMAYLRSSESQRRALLAGLLDTDGTVTSTGSIQFTTTSERLAGDVRELIASLGYRVSISTKRVRGRSAASSVAFNATFTTHDDVFRLERKRLLQKERMSGKSAARHGMRFISCVIPVASVPVRCIEVENDSHLYLAGESMIPTHNST